jgi:glycosyltransferase involved in cell wall biosynthesis
VTVSVILPTYNRPKLLMGRAIPSVLAQTEPDWECHVIGDGTDDETVRRMEELVAADSRFRFTNLPRTTYPDGTRWDHWGLLGLDVLNYGLETATGNWISVLNDDDEFTPDHHQILISLADEKGVDFAYGMSVTPWGQEYGAWPPGDAQLTQGSYVYRGRARDFRYDLRCILDRGLNGDADMWTRMYSEGVTFAMTGKRVHRYYPASSRPTADDE